MKRIEKGKYGVDKIILNVYMYEIHEKILFVYLELIMCRNTSQYCSELFIIYFSIKFYY